MSFSTILVDDFMRELEAKLGAPKSDKLLFYAIVNAPFENRRVTTMLGLGFITLVMVDKSRKTIDRIEMTANDLSQGARDVTVKPFEELIIPLNYKGNAVVEAIRSGRYQQTSDWNYLLAPVLEPDEARLNQAGAGIASSFVYPMQSARDGGALIYHYFVSLDKIEKDQKDFMFRYCKLVANVLNEKN